MENKDPLAWAPAGAEQRHGDESYRYWPGSGNREKVTVGRDPQRGG